MKFNIRGDGLYTQFYVFGCFGMRRNSRLYEVSVHIKRVYIVFVYHRASPK